MTPYPDIFPVGAITALINFARGGDSKISDVIHAAWCVTGYALSQALPVENKFGALPKVEGPLPPLTDEEKHKLATALDHYLAVHEGRMQAGDFEFSWTALLPLLARVLDQLLHLYLDRA